MLTSSIVFFTSLFFIFFAYFGYPLTLLIYTTIFRKIHTRKYIYPSITLIITAFNEEKRIKEKIENTLQLEYPKDKIQIMVASDGSTDNTNAIVQSFTDQGVELFKVKNRGGKENAQKEAIPHSSGEIIIFSDVATILEPKGLKEIVSNFADPKVGCVSSEDVIIGQDGKPTGEGFYVRYEMWLRRLESQANSLVGLSGSFFAARKEVCQDFSGDVQSDFRTLLSSVKLGLRGVSDQNSLGSYLNISDEKQEFNRKVRTVLRGLTVFFRHLEFLNIFKYGMFSYQFFCHKLLRWLVPLFLAGAIISNILLVENSDLFLFIMAGQILFYFLAVYGWITQSLQSIWKIPTFFLIVNTAIAIAWYQYLTGKRVVLWNPSKR